MIGISVLGSTGSIGVSTLDVVARHPERYRVVALTHAGEIEIDHVFEVRGRGVEWEIYDEGVDGAAVKRVLHVFPDAVMECEEGGQVRTPFGVFRIVRRRRKRVRCPSGLWTHAAERIQARIRPGKRLQRQVPEGPSEPLAEDIPISAPDEDPES